MALILIVDDEVTVRDILSRWLTAAGHETHQADSSDAALVEMEKSPASVVFTDIQMPGRDGLWLTAELRRRYPKTAVVLATSVSTVAPRVTMQAGVLAYLVKPFNKQSVLDALETALAWNTEALANPPRPVTVEGLLAWLDSLQ